MVLQRDHIKRACLAEAPTTIMSLPRRSAEGAEGENLLRERRDSLLDLRDRLSDLLFAGRVRRHFELALHLGLGQPQRLDLSEAFGVWPPGVLAGLASFLFPFFHALGEAGLRVDEAFSGITHRS
jgi:hypothetical protein